MSYTTESMKGSIMFKQVSMWLAYNAAQRTANLMSCVEGLISLLAALPHLRQTFPNSRSQRLHPDLPVQRITWYLQEKFHVTRIRNLGQLHLLQWHPHCFLWVRPWGGRKLDPRVKCFFFITALAWWMSLHWISSEPLTVQLHNP